MEITSIYDQVTVRQELKKLKKLNKLKNKKNDDPNLGPDRVLKDSHDMSLRWGHHQIQPDPARITSDTPRCGVAAKTNHFGFDHQLLFIIYHRNHQMH